MQGKLGTVSSSQRNPLRFRATAILYLCLDGNGPGAAQILSGQMPPPDILRGLLPETKAILHTLTTLPHTETLNTAITTPKFQKLYNLLPEKISSSPSGRHIGHYKAIVKSDDLSEIWSTMMSILLKAGFSPRRWREVVDVMLEKSPGNSKIHRLHIVALQESDFKQSNCLAIGWPVMHHLEDKKLIPKMQHGLRSAKLCISVVLNN
jgi:hypothetical protein